VAKRNAVVLAEMTGDANADAQIRAAVDDVAVRLRRNGYELAPPAKVGEMLGGAQGSEAERFTALRTALSAIIVKIAIKGREPARVSLLVSVIADAGERQQPVDSPPGEIAQRVPPVVEAMLPRLGAAEGAPGAAGLDRVTLKDGSVIEGRIVQQEAGKYVVVQSVDGRRWTLNWDQVQSVVSGGPGAGGFDDKAARVAGAAGRELPAEAWKRRGGSLVSFGVEVLLGGILHREPIPFSRTFQNGERMIFTANSPAGGGGGGIGLRLGYLELAMPSPAEGSTPYGLRLGSGLDVVGMVYVHRNPELIVDGLRDAAGSSLIDAGSQGGGTTTTSCVALGVPFVLGGVVGVGGFETDKRWAGVVLGLDWRPTYLYAKPADGDAVGGFNPAGFQLTADLTSIEASEKDRPLEGHFRMAVALLPPVGDKPLFLTLGFGSAWY
jgi:hypothetical protein